ncbi:regulator of nonsense transcripts 2-like isoform X3 [Apostichopus japonicus]|uniref:regulator of nonsense transcripts 2-like isoform X3 n=1 Tax=Stichopus japonicus TaxID=307972 RepID=UPI003AB64D16
MTKDEKSRGAKEGATADTPAAKKSTDKDTKRASNGSMQKVTKGGETGSSDARKDYKTSSKEGDHDKKRSLTKDELAKLEQEKRRINEEERKKREDDKKRKEEEKKRKEEEAKIDEERKKEEEQKRQEEEAKMREEEEKKNAAEMYKESVERKEIKRLTRDKNLSAAENRPDEDFFVRKDSSLKKNTAFVKKLKTLTESQRESLSKEFEGLNLTKYISEAATSISEAKIKMADIPCAIYMASLMHRRYVDFAAHLLDAIQRSLPVLMKKDEKDKNIVTFDPRIRLQLRLLAELIVHGIFTEKEGLPLLNNALATVLKSDRENHSNLSIIISFTKYCGEDFAGITSRKSKLLAQKYGHELLTSEVVSPQPKTAYRHLLKDHFIVLSKHLKDEHKALKNLERHSRKILQTKGELSTERRKTLEETQTAFQKLQINTSNFSDLIDEDMPDLPKDEVDEDDLLTIDFLHPEKNMADFDFENSRWEDEDTRTFHENLIDLRTMVPAILFKNCAKIKTPEETSSAEDMKKLEEDLKMMEITESSETESQASKGTAEGEEDPSLPLEAEMVVEEVEPEEDQVLEEDQEGEVEQEEAEDGETNPNMSMKVMLDTFLQKLPTCINRDFIDKAAVEFCMNLNTKANRKRLVQCLVDVPRQRLDLLPFYSRLVATLHSCMSDVATNLADKLKMNFRYHLRKKDQMHIESKIKTVRFIGELTKFKMYPKVETLQCLKSLLQDFRHHNIDMACAVLETCGRFLYRTADSHLRVKILLDMMMRKKSRMPLDDRHNTMIENAFYYCNPPEVQKAERKVRPPMHEYIRKLLFKDLSKNMVEKVLKQMRKLDWTDQKVKLYAMKCLSSVWNIKFGNIHCMANLVAGLVSYYDNVGIYVVDGVLEDIRAGMEINHPKFNQRRVSMVKFLGELYNYKMVESTVIFRVLYSFIRVGVSLDANNPTPFDPPDHLFRIRLVCTLLDTCGHFFDRGNSKKRLDCFLIYFQQYYFFKKSLPVFDPEARPFPLDCDNAVMDTVECLRPKLKFYADIEEANQAVADLKRDCLQKLSEKVPPEQLAAFQQQMNQSNDTTGYPNLPSIMEGDENESEDFVRTPAGFSDMLEDDEDSDSVMEVDADGDGFNSAPNSQSQLTGEEETADDVDGMDEDEDLPEESAGETEEDDQMAVIKGAPKLINCEEDDDFSSEYEKLMAETYQRTVETSKVPQLDIGVPVLHKPTPKKLTFSSMQPLQEEEKNTMNFTLMTKKGNKQQLKAFEVPIDSTLVTNLKNREEAEQAEKQRLKKLTLDINERQEEEDYQAEMLATLQRPATTVIPRDTSKPRFNHPKGAPDVNDIFNAKGNRRW